MTGTLLMDDGDFDIRDIDVVLSPDSKGRTRGNFYSASLATDWGDDAGRLGIMRFAGAFYLSQDTIVRVQRAGGSYFTFYEESAPDLTAFWQRRALHDIGAMARTGSV